MADKERNALIPSPSGGLESIGSGPKGILSGMVSDALALVRVREKSLATARFRIGDYEFRDPDYQQILIWAKALEIEPEVFINCLYDSPSDLYDFEVVTFEVEDGSIVSLVWDFDKFPISSFEWVDGLRIKQLGFRGLASTKISLHLPLLNFLDCSYIGLTELDLSRVPELTRLSCYGNQLIELDLSKVPELTNLQCGGNQLVELDLSKVPALKKLLCYGNQLVELDLSKVPELTNLQCCENQFVELDLSKVPALIELWCSDCQLVELDLSKVPALSELFCGNYYLCHNGNKLVKLDLSKVPALTKLECSDCQLVELDLSKVPALTKLDCHDNELVKLDLSKVPALKELECDPFVSLKKLHTHNF